METAYLKKCFGSSLTQGLAEVARVRPSDPIEYLAHWLYHYRNITKAEEKVCCVPGLLGEDTACSEQIEIQVVVLSWPGVLLAHLPSKDCFVPAI